MKKANEKRSENGKDFWTEHSGLRREINAKRNHTFTLEERGFRT